MRNRLLLGAVLLGSGFLGSCSDGDDGDSVEDGIDRSSVLESLTERAVLPALAELTEATGGLVTATAAYASVASETTTTELEAARSAFRSAYVAMQTLEPMQFGPAGAPSSFLGGEAIRDELYSWPETNACRVDQLVVAQSYEDTDFFTNTLVNGYGFDALEYLLFPPSLDNSCTAPVTINRDGTWDALGDAEVISRRADYAAAVSSELDRQARALEQRWLTSGGNFSSELSGAGASSAVYGSAQEALDQVFAGMFYLDRQVKDLKLAAPLGISGACTTGSTCPDLVESPHADLGLESLRANLRGFRALFTGALDGDDGVGYDDLLV
ncbi:MAG: imelysin family protein, partial [Myxococcota bacterium]